MSPKDNDGAVVNGRLADSERIREVPDGLCLSCHRGRGSKRESRRRARPINGGTCDPWSQAGGGGAFTAQLVIKDLAGVRHGLNCNGGCKGGGAQIVDAPEGFRPAGKPKCASLGALTYFQRHVEFRRILRKTDA